MGVGCEVVVGKSSLSIHLLCNGEKTQKLWKPLLTQFSLSEASRNGLHNGIERDDFPTTTAVLYWQSFALLYHRWDKMPLHRWDGTLCAVAFPK